MRVTEQNTSPTVNYECPILRRSPEPTRNHRSRKDLTNMGTLSVGPTFMIYYPVYGVGLDNSTLNRASSDLSNSGTGMGFRKDNSRIKVLAVFPVDGRAYVGEVYDFSGVFVSSNLYTTGDKFGHTMYGPRQGISGVVLGR